VTIKNGTTDRAQNAYNEYVKNAGLLEVNGRAPADTGTNNYLPDAAQHQQSGYGFDDVRLIDASAMTGKLSFTAQFSEKAVEKYLNLKDVLAPAGDNINVVYTGGAAADSMKVDIESKAVASNSNINVGREDFSFAFNGGAGDDVLDIAIDRNPADANSLIGGSEVWYTNHRINNNVTINAGDGNDTVKTPGVGDFNINLGAGNDTVYTDNTGKQTVALRDKTGALTTGEKSNAVWVLNTSDQQTASIRELSNLQSDLRQTVGSYGVKLTVSFHGLTKTVDLSDKDYLLSDLEVNQAIKDAVNGDSVLNKLLKAEDGPSGTLVVTSLIDGVHAEDAFVVSAVAPALTDLNATVLAAYNTANSTTNSTTHATTTDMLNQITTNVANWFGNDGDRFNAVFANDRDTDGGGADTAAKIVGANGTASSDNVISGDAGNDVIVLSTTGNAQAGIFGDATDKANTDQLPFSNETIKFGLGFGNDVIVNFRADTLADITEFSAGYDILDFTALNGDIKLTGVGAQTDLVTLVATNKSINVIALVDAGADKVWQGTDNFNADALKKTLDANNTVDGIGAGTESNHVFIVYDTNNVGSVYTVVDGIADNDVVVTLQGTIDLADTAWNTLTLNNFI